MIKKIRTRGALSHSLTLLTLIAGVRCATAYAAILGPGVQQRLANSTFEVVLAKPVADPLTYEKPLPLELIPYRERTDKFQSIGTAFSIGPNRFVSAAHVITAGNGSQYGPLALRNAAGTTYPIDKVIKYSSSEDYAVFSVRGAPSVVPLETRSRPPLNSPVFAVGNALGEGVVVRDGMYTSDTPEELEGRWQWLRFSAAASPGNSGGPLVDRNGKVVGVVVRKSPNENLNFALAIGQVLEGSEQAAVLESRSSYRMIVMKAADSISFNEKIGLPKALDDFYASVRQVGDSFAKKVRADYRKTHAEAMFPKGNSEQLLSSVYAEPFPKLISQSDGGAWSLVGDAPRKVDLDKHGYLQAGTANGMLFVRLKAPDGVSNADLVADSKKFMDLLLQGYPVTRPVGADAVRVTSMGNASEEIWFTDTYRRKWQVRTWLVPFNDTVMISVALPTPDGMVMVIAQAPTVLKEAVQQEMEGVCDFFYVSYTGTTEQWYAFLSNLKVLPETVLNKKVQLDSGHGVGIDSSRFKFLIPASVLRIDDGSVLTLDYTYMRDGAGTVWDLGGIYLADSVQNRRWVGLLRRLKPSPAMPEETAHTWRAMTTGTPPWQGVPFLAGGRTEINAMVNMKDVAAGKTNVGYTVSISYEGNQLPYINIHDAFLALERGTTITE